MSRSIKSLRGLDYQDDVYVPRLEFEVNMPSVKYVENTVKARDHMLYCRIISPKHKQPIDANLANTREHCINRSINQPIN